MNAEDLNDICGRSVRGAPIDADHVLEIIADLTAARAELADWAAQDERNLAELAEQRLELKATQAGWLVEINKVARVRELCDEPCRGINAAHDWRRVDEILAALEGNQL